MKSPSSSFISSLAITTTAFCFSMLSPQSRALEIIVVTNSNGNTQSLVNFLEAEGHSVTRAPFTDGVPDFNLIDLNDIVIVTRETNSADYANGTEAQEWNALPLPVINMSVYLMRASRWGWVNGENLPTKNNITAFDPYPNPLHPFLTGLSNPETTIFSTPTSFAGLSDALPAGSTNVADFSAGTSRGLFVIPSGASMFGNRGTAGADRIGFIRGDVGSWSSINGNGGQILRNILSVYNPVVPGDIDRDGLDDNFEQLIINANTEDELVELIDVLPGDDFDMDGLTNLQEHNLDPRTNPTNPDTDSDRINDGQEVSGILNIFNSGTPNGPPGEPTNPRRADSDNDGINDLDEIESANGFVTNPNDSDSDDDLMPDGYEIAHSQNPLLNDAALDPDNDMSNNLNEYNVKTNPLDEDTDKDGYKDGVETNDRTFNNLGSDTGTDPLNPDTDGDGLPDGIEKNGGDYVNSEDTGSNPLNVNTDGDAFRDGAEVNIHKTDPTKSASFPLLDYDILFIGGGVTGTTGADEVAIAYIEDKYGIGKITYVQGNAATAAGAEAGYDLLVISSTITSGDVRGKFNKSTIPVVYWEQLLNVNETGDFGLTDTMSINNSITSLNLTPHPVTAGLPSPLALFRSGGADLYYTTTLGSSVISLATGANGAGLNNPMFMVVETGAALVPGTGVPNDVAPARRVFFPFSDDTFSNLSKDAFSLVGNSLDWALGRLGGERQMRIKAIHYDDTTDPGNVLVTLTFTSTIGKKYNIYTSIDFNAPFAQRDEVVDQIPGGEGETSFVIDFNVSQLLPAVPRRFFVVKEMP